MKQKLLLPVVALALLSACSNNSTEGSATGNGGAEKKGSFDLTAARKTIDESNQQLAKAMTAGDSAAVVAIYHSEAQVYPPDMPAGDRMAMAGMTKSFPSMGIKTASLRSTEVTGDSAMLVESGVFEIGDGNKTVDKGKYMVVWKKEGGKWKMYRDIWNSDAPPAVE